MSALKAVALPMLIRERRQQMMATSISARSGRFQRVETCSVINHQRDFRFVLCEIGLKKIAWTQGEEQTHI